MQFSILRIYLKEINYCQINNKYLKTTAKTFQDNAANNTNITKEFLFLSKIDY